MVDMATQVARAKHNWGAAEDERTAPTVLDKGVRRS